jgi:hypothetical protein
MCHDFADKENHNKNRNLNSFHCDLSGIKGRKSSDCLVNLYLNINYNNYKILILQNKK